MSNQYISLAEIAARRNRVGPCVLQHDTLTFVHLKTKVGVNERMQIIIPVDLMEKARLFVGDRVDVLLYDDMGVIKRIVPTGNAMGWRLQGRSSKKSKSLGKAVRAQVDVPLYATASKRFFLNEARVFKPKQVEVTAEGILFETAK